MRKLSDFLFCTPLYRLINDSRPINWIILQSKFNFIDIFNEIIHHKLHMLIISTLKKHIKHMINI